MTVSIVFMGTPDFSVPALKALHKAGYSIPLVISQPDRPKGRGRKLVETPVKKAALELGLHVDQPHEINSEDMIEKIEALKPDFFVVVAFGQIIEKRLLSAPKFAPVNIHASLLPEYRGAAPMQRSLIACEPKTGVTTMFMNEGLDTGDILLSKEMDIYENDTSDTLSERLAQSGAELVVKTIEEFRKGQINAIPQNHDIATYAPRLKKKEGLINWHNTSQQLDCFVRGMTSWPGAFTFLDGKRFKIIKAVPVDTTASTVPGTVIECTSERMVIQAGSGAMSVLEIQGESGKRLKISDFLRGHPVSEGARFE